MNKLIFTVAVSALAAAAGAQTMPNAQSIEEVRISRSQPLIEYPPLLRNVWYDEFDTVKGTYYLSNGKTMQLSMWGNRMYAKIDGVDKLQLLAESPYVFVARNLQMKIMIDDPGNSSGPLRATVALAAPLVSSTAPAGDVITLLAHR